MDLEKNSSCRWQERNPTASLSGSSMSRYRVGWPAMTGIDEVLSRMHLLETFDGLFRMFDGRPHRHIREIANEDLGDFSKIHHMIRRRA